MAVHEVVLRLVCACRNAGMRDGWLFPAAAGLEVGHRFGLCSADVRLPAVPGRPQQSRQQGTLPRCQSGDIADSCCQATYRHCKTGCHLATISASLLAMLYYGCPEDAISNSISSGLSCTIFAFIASPMSSLHAIRVTYSACSLASVVRQAASQIGSFLGPALGGALADLAGFR